MANALSPDFFGPTINTEGDVLQFYNDLIKSTENNHSELLGDEDIKYHTLQSGDSSIGKVSLWRLPSMSLKGPYQMLITNFWAAKLQGILLNPYVSSEKKPPNLNGLAHHLVTKHWKCQELKQMVSEVDSMHKMYGPGLYNFLLFFIYFFSSYSMLNHVQAFVFPEISYNPLF